jgi:hypothetical protein
MLQKCKGFARCQKIVLTCRCLLIVSVKRDMFQSTADLRVGCMPGCKQKNTPTVNNCTEGAKKGVKQSPYGPGDALRVSGGWGYEISRQSAHEGSKVISPTHRPPLPSQEICLLHTSVRGRVHPRTIVCHHVLPRKMLSKFIITLKSSNFNSSCCSYKELYPCAFSWWKNCFCVNGMVWFGLWVLTHFLYFCVNFSR